VQVERTWELRDLVEGKVKSLREEFRHEIEAAQSEATRLHAQLGARVEQEIQDRLASRKVEGGGVRWGPCVSTHGRGAAGRVLTLVRQSCANEPSNRRPNTTPYDA
jgi:hypothetical protein